MQSEGPEFWKMITTYENWKTTARIKQEQKVMHKIMKIKKNSFQKLLKSSIEDGATRTDADLCTLKKRGQTLLV